MCSVKTFWRGWGGRGGWLVPHPRFLALDHLPLHLVCTSEFFRSPSVSFKTQTKSHLALDSIAHIPAHRGALVLCLEVWPWKEKGTQWKSQLFPLQATQLLYFSVFCHMHAADIGL